MSKKTIRTLFILLFPFLFLQYHVSKKYREPYPAVIYPEFATPIKNKNKTKYIKYHYHLVFENGDIKEIHSNDLFGKIAPRAKEKFVYKNFISHNIQVRKTPLYIKNRLKNLYDESVKEIVITRYQYIYHHNNFPQRIEIKLKNQYKYVDN